MYSVLRRWFSDSKDNQVYGEESENNSEHGIECSPGHSHEQPAVDPMSGAVTFARNLGSSIYHSAIKSGGYAAQLIHEPTVLSNIEISVRSFVDKVPILRDFQQLQDSFASEQRQKKFHETHSDSSNRSVLLPWDAESAGLTDQNTLDKLKLRILELSKHANTFLLAPPEEAQVDGDVFQSIENVQMAKALLEEDPNLSQMRYRLVPTKIHEDCFWRNYFYRISIVRQSFQLSALTDVGSDEFVCVNDDPNWNHSSSDEIAADPSPHSDCFQAERIRKQSIEHLDSKKQVTSPSTPERLLSERTANRPPDGNVLQSDDVSADDLLEAELAREVSDVVVIGSADEAQLEAELELELAQLEPLDKKSP